MTMTWDLTDVPAVAPADLAAAMQALIDDERGLVLLRGLADARSRHGAGRAASAASTPSPSARLPCSSASGTWSRCSPPAA